MKVTLFENLRLRRQVGQGASITFENSTYPREEWNVPVKAGSKDGKHQVARKFFEILNKPVPITPEEEERERSGWKAFSSPNTSFDSDFEDWVRDGPFWRRVRVGPNPHCWTNSRLNATAWWKDAEGRYCCHGRPFFSEKQMKEFRAGMELVKPLLEFESPGGKVVLALARTLHGAVGNCWGISTCQQMYAAEKDGGLILIEKTKASMERFIKSCFDDTKKQR